MITFIYDGVEYICTTTTTITDDTDIPDVYNFSRLENGRFMPIPTWDF